MPVSLLLCACSCVTQAKKEDKEKSDKDKTEDLVSVGITAKGGDGVQVKIDYPPLSASA